MKRKELEVTPDSTSLDEPLRTKSKQNDENRLSIVSTSLDYSQVQLVPWFQAKGFTGLEHLEFRYSEKCGQSLGCFALKSYSVGEVIFSIPQSCIFNYDPLLSTPLAQFVQSTLQKHGLIDSKEFLYWIHMIAERESFGCGIVSNGMKSNLQVYFQSLSKVSPSLLNWDPNLLSTLQGSNLGKSITDLKELLVDYSKLIEQIHEFEPEESTKFLPKNIFTYDSLLWAAGHYLSRRYPESFGTKNDENEIKLSFSDMDTSSSNQLSMLGNVGSLVPLLDILNHNHEREWIKFSVKDYKLQIICNYPIQKGQEIYSNYGCLSNGQLLLAFGYSLEDNPHDEYLLKLKIPNKPFFQSYFESNRVENTPEMNESNQQFRSQLFSIQRGGIKGIPDNLLVLLALLDKFQSNPNQSSSSSNNSTNMLKFGMSSNNLEKFELIMPFLLNQLNLMKEIYPK